MKNLKKLHTFGIVVGARDVAFIESVADAVAFLRMKGPKVLLGRGADVFFCEDFQGTAGIVKTSGLKIQDEGELVRISAMAGEDWHGIVQKSCEAGLFQLANLAYIPGTAGAAPVQNLGAYGSEFSDFCESLDILRPDGTIENVKAENCGFGYRTSDLRNLAPDDGIIWQIHLRLDKRANPNLTHGPLKQFESEGHTPIGLMHKVMEIRREKLPDPAEHGSAGSFFKNPIVSHELALSLKEKYPEMPTYDSDGGVKLAAGWLIDKAGLKGATCGGAAIWSKQALVIVNMGDAVSSDVVNLARMAKSEVLKKFGVRLTPEIRIFGAEGEIAGDSVI